MQVLDIQGCNSANKPSFQNPTKSLFAQCSIDGEVTSGGRAEIEIVKNNMPSDLPFHLPQQMLLLKCHCTFNIYRQWGKNVWGPT